MQVSELRNFSRKHEKKKIAQHYALEHLFIDSLLPIWCLRSDRYFVSAARCYWHRHSQDGCGRFSKFTGNACEAKCQLFSKIPAVYPGERTATEDHKVVAHSQIPLQLSLHKLCGGSDGSPAITFTLSSYGRRSERSHSCKKLSRREGK